MKKKIKYSYNVISQYQDGCNVIFGLEFDKIKSYVSKILNTLLSYDEVCSNTCFADLKFDTLSFDIIFVDDNKIQDINREYRQKDRPTDVITFALFADDDFKMIFENEINLGEILISVDTAIKQSKDNNNSFETEILTLICHGVLHLFGFDHLTNEDYNFIVKIQNDVLNAILS